MAEVLTAKSDQAEIATSIRECKRLGVPILPPDINLSGEGFTVEKLTDGRTGIRFGIQAIKGISSAEEIKANRPYTSVDDFFSKVSGSVINKAKAEALILAGAFDSLEPNRHTVYTHYFGNIRKDKPVDEDTFNKLKEVKKHSTSYVPKQASKYSEKFKFRYEQDLMGMCVSGHPLDDYPCKPWSMVYMNESVEYIGILKKVNINQTKTNKAYSFFKIETREDIIEAVIWPTEFSKYGDRLLEGETVIVRGKKTNSRDKDQLVVNQVLVNPRSMNKQSNTKDYTDIALNMTPQANPVDDLYNQDSVDNILYGNNQPVSEEPIFNDDITPIPDEQVVNNGLEFGDLFGGYC